MFINLPQRSQKCIDLNNIFIINYYIVASLCTPAAW